jgi:Trypsin
MNMFAAERIFGGSILALAWLVLACSSQTSEKILVFERDDRRDLYDGDKLERQAAKAVALRVAKSQINDGHQNDTVFIKNSYQMIDWHWCEDEPFSYQWTPNGSGECTGFTVGKNLLLTAYHCVPNDPGTRCGEWSFVFGFSLNNRSDRPDRDIPKENVYDCNRVIAAGKKRLGLGLGRITVTRTQNDGSATCTGTGRRGDRRSSEKC